MEGPVHVLRQTYGRQGEVRVRVETVANVPTGWIQDIHDFIMESFLDVVGSFQEFHKNSRSKSHNGGVPVIIPYSGVSGLLRSPVQIRDVKGKRCSMVDRIHVPQTLLQTCEDTAK
jgi:hypothetical protein